MTEEGGNPINLDIEALQNDEAYQKRHEWIVNILASIASIVSNQEKGEDSLRISMPNEDQGEKKIQSAEKSPREILFEDLMTQLEGMAAAFGKSEITVENYKKFRSHLGHLVRVASRGGERDQEKTEARFLYALTLRAKAYEERDETVADGTKVQVNNREEDISQLQKECGEKNIPEEQRKNALVVLQWFGKNGKPYYHIYTNPSVAYALEKRGSWEFPEEGTAKVNKFVAQANDLLTRFRQFEEDHKDEIARVRRTKKTSPEGAVVPAEMPKTVEELQRMLTQKEGEIAGLKEKIRRQEEAISPTVQELRKAIAEKERYQRLAQNTFRDYQAAKEQLRRKEEEEKLFAGEELAIYYQELGRLIREGNEFERAKEMAKFILEEYGKIK